jgi:glycosyltransferase EpsF
METSNQKSEYRVLHIFSGYGGGISSLILNLLENKSKDFTFDIMAFSYKGGERFLKRVHAIGTESYLMPRPRLEGWKKFWDFINQVMVAHAYDAVHCHIDGLRAVPFQRAAVRHHIHTFILHAHKTQYERHFDMLPFVRYMNQRTNYGIATDYMTCSKLAADFIFGSKYLLKRKATLIHNGVNISAYKTALSIKQQQAYNQEFGVEEDTLVFMHVGRFNLQKNHDFILQLIVQLKMECRPFVFLFAGDGELFTEVYAKASRMGILNSVRFIGHRNDIPYLLKYADLLILPSTWEGLPTVAIESQAAGTPIILSDSITRECDMNLGLVKFLPITSTSIWTEAMISRVRKEYPSPEKCLSMIQKNGFTAGSAGESYCNCLKKIIRNNERK